MSTTIVKLSTQYYKDDNNAYVKKVLTRLKRRSEGYDLLLEECDNMDCKEVLSNIVNLFTVDDGIYELDTCNISRNWEDDHIQQYDYILKEIK